MDDLNNVKGENLSFRRSGRNRDSRWTTGIFDYESHRNLPPAFWGDIDKYLDWLSMPQSTAPSNMPTEPSSPSTKTDVGNAMPGGARTSRHESEMEQPPIRGEVSEKALTEPHSDYKIYRQEGSRLASVEELRSSYMLGKLAGEDLHGPTGQLIARKHQVISKDIIDEAERAGMLVQLIVNMVIPGLGE